MLLIEQTIGAASANANNRSGPGSNRSVCSEAAQPMRAEAEVASVARVSVGSKTGSDARSRPGPQARQQTISNRKPGINSLPLATAKAPASQDEAVRVSTIGRKTENC